MVVFSLEAPNSAHQYLMIAKVDEFPRVTFFGNSECLGNFLKVEDVGLDSVESALTFEDHLRHLVPRRLVKTMELPVTWVLYVGRYVDFGHLYMVCGV